ncbi:MAG: hypothetical protein ABSB70_00040 [Candidatus Velthaea sp.]|jgi:hypothetical protein
MKSALKTGPKPALSLVPGNLVPANPGLPIPIDDAEAAALYLAEIMPPAIRRELGRLLVASA